MQKRSMYMSWVLTVCFFIVGIIFMMKVSAEEPVAATNPSAKGTPIVVLETTKGTIELKLYPDVAPKAAENFQTLATRGYYNGIIFHRVIAGFMIQCGDPTGTGMGGESMWGSDFEDEFSSSVSFDKEGLLAMANRGPATNGSQFFITTVPTPHLNMHHTIFGEVVTGMDIVHAIENTAVDANDKPVEEVKVVKAYVKNAE